MFPLQLCRKHVLQTTAALERRSTHSSGRARAKRIIRSKKLALPSGTGSFQWWSLATISQSQSCTLSLTLTGTIHHVSAYASPLISISGIKDAFHTELEDSIKRLPENRHLIILGESLARQGNDQGSWPITNGRKIEVAYVYRVQNTTFRQYGIEEAWKLIVWNLQRSERHHRRKIIAEI